MEGRIESNKSDPPTEQPRMEQPVEEMMCKIREDTAKVLSYGLHLHDMNIEQKIRETRAIIMTNAEIFDRIMNTVYSKGGRRTFVRYSYNMVETRTINKDTTSTQFITYPERSEKTFDMTPLEKLPVGLNDIIVSKRKESPFSMFIDYGSFFERSLNLHEDVLGPFLSRLKGHLMDIQVSKVQWLWLQEIILH